MTKDIKRRDFLKKGTAAGLGIALGSIALNTKASVSSYQADGKPELFKPKALGKVRIGYVGVGGMGTAHVRNLLKIENAELVAVCDIVESRVERAQKMAVEAGKPKPKGYSKGEYDYKRLCASNKIDLVYIATPWKWHVPMCLEAMNNGKHAAVEVPAALTVDECWQLVETSEKTKLHCIMMENCNYDKTEMIILNMVRKGLLGELLHAECGYLHDLRAVKHDMNGEGVWRRAHSMHRNGDLYPTHGLGPVAQCMDINRGNQFDYMVSFASKTRGLHKYALEQFGVDSQQAKEAFVLGDVVTTLIRTKKGETIILKHDTSSPRPYSRDILVQGTQGIVRKYPKPRIHIEGTSPSHRWEDLSKYKDEYYHPLWKELEEKSKGAGHGGMDFLEDYRLVNALSKGLYPDMDVYDAAALSVICELSEKSIESNGRPVDIPDFTRGLWKEFRPLPVDEI